MKLDTNSVLSTLREFAARVNLHNPQVHQASEGIDWVSHHGVVAYVEGETELLGKRLLIRVGVPSDFPNELPFVQLVTSLSDLTDTVTPHVERDGNLCYAPTREVVFDPALQNGLLLLEATFNQAMQSLENALTTTDNTELLDEITSYWEHAQPLKRQRADLVAYVVPDDELRLVHAWEQADRKEKPKSGKRKLPTAADHRIVAVADLLDAPTRYQQLNSPLGPPSRDALYLPLSFSPTLRPPPLGKFWTPAEFRQIVREHLTPEQLTELEVLLTARRHKRDLILLGIPRPSGQGLGRRSLVAVEVTGGGPHLLLEQSTAQNFKIAPRSVERRDQPYIMQRGGSDTTLSNKAILVLGCGSLGGHLVSMLASAGIGHMTLVDHDVFSPANTFRHFLGRRFVGRSKVEGMRQALLEKYPYIQVEPLFGRTAQLIAAGKLDLADFDLVVDATGNATHHLTLGDALHETLNTPPAVLTWLDALGLGGHVATAFPGVPGCPRCLYSNPNTPLYNRVAFAKAGSKLGQTALGCGGYFTPFSDLDAVETATLAARVAVRVLTGSEKRNAVFAWKGDKTAFEAAGHEVSIWYTSSEPKMLRQGVPYVTLHCPVCGS
ncbi:ThiF family adenylyltransferase [Deinococcus sp. SL84]|uniref:ThiF family adenylyltransferase n=1 Tax=Deinococcus sp. SL84 TaxID=2994663 RepID=UPI002274FE82|nr:ThiF family adenylyltransferase [Deinococcus sp. SL84]MCY1704279.1 ThiF family adenylyltransferase [Deinococcus sp. SL84]